MHKVVCRKRKGDNSVQNPRNVKKVANRTQRVNVPSQQQTNPLDMLDHPLFQRLDGFSLAINNTFYNFSGTVHRPSNASAAIIAAENAMIAANASINSIAASVFAMSRATSRLSVPSATVAPIGNNNTAPPMRMSSTSTSSPLGNSGMPSGARHSSPLVHQTIRMGVSQYINMPRSQLHLPGAPAMHSPVNNTQPVQAIRMRISQYVNQSNATIQPPVVREIFARTGRTLGGTQNVAYSGFSNNISSNSWPIVTSNMSNGVTTATGLAPPSDFAQGGYGSLATHRNAGSPPGGFNFGASPLQPPPELSFLGGSGIPSSSVRREMISASVSTGSGATINHEFGNLSSTLPGLFILGTSTSVTPSAESRTVGTSTFSSIRFAGNENEHRR